MVKRKDYSGLTLGYLTVIGPRGTNGKRALWAFQCVCGAEKVIEARDIRKMITRNVRASCGCMKRKTISEKKKSHGMSRHPAYAVWASMKARCLRPSHDAWGNYGGRGITVCQRWLDGFENFWADMGPTYQRGLEIDRRDNNGGYSLGNCRWVTSTTQHRNRRDNVRMSGLTGIEIAQATGLSRSTVYYRLKAGVTPEQMLERPDSSRKFMTSSTAAHVVGSPSGPEGKG